MENLSNLIRHSRQLKDYSQEYMAQYLGITQQGYSKIEKYPEKAKFQHIQKLASLLEITILEKEF